MIRIESHIEKLLLSHDCVILAGIGGFITRYESSFVEDNEIYPPYRSISFNSQLKDNDGLLVQSYMSAYDTSYPRAQLLVEEDIREINNALQESGEYIFRRIGKLQLTQNQSLVFTPIDGLGLFSKDHYGLAPYTIEEMTAIQVAPTETPKAEATIYKLDTVGIDERPEEKPVKTLTTEQDNSHYVIRISKRSVRYAIATVAAALLYFVFTIAPSANPVFTNVQEAALVSSIRTSTPDRKSQPAPRSNKPTKQRPAAKRTEAPKRMETSPTRCPEAPTTKCTETPKQEMQSPQQKPIAGHKEQAKVSGHTENYTIVIASAISQQGGERLIENLKKEHLGRAQFVRDGKMNRVTYNSYKTREEACEALSKLRQSSDRFASAWVMKR